MSVTGRCINTCTTPKQGFIEEDQVIEFSDINTWDVKKFPFLKHFEEIAVLSDKSDDPLFD